MKAVIMYRNSYHGGDGWTYYPMVVDIAETCPKCGYLRGEPKRTRFCDDGEYYEVDVWKNPCGHVDSYKDVYFEHAKRGNEK